MSRCPCSPFSCHRAPASSILRVSFYVNDPVEPNIALAKICSHSHTLTTTTQKKNVFKVTTNYRCRSSLFISFFQHVTRSELAQLRYRKNEERKKNFRWVWVCVCVFHHFSMETKSPPFSIDIKNAHKTHKFIDMLHQIEATKPTNQPTIHSSDEPNRCDLNEFVNTFHGFLNTFIC